MAEIARTHCLSCMLSDKSHEVRWDGHFIFITPVKAVLSGAFKPDQFAEIICVVEQLKTEWARLEAKLSRLD